MLEVLITIHLLFKMLLLQCIFLSLSQDNYYGFIQSMVAKCYPNMDSFFPLCFSWHWKPSIWKLLSYGLKVILQYFLQYLQATKLFSSLKMSKRYKNISKDIFLRIVSRFILFACFSFKNNENFTLLSAGFHYAFEKVAVILIHLLR